MNSKSYNLAVTAVTFTKHFNIQADGEFYSSFMRAKRVPRLFNDLFNFYIISNPLCSHFEPRYNKSPNMTVN